MPLWVQKMNSFLLKVVLAVIRRVLRRHVVRPLFDARDKFQGLVYFRNSIMPVEYKPCKGWHKDSAYFRKYGFSVPMIYSDCYSNWNGIKSDRYISTDLYYNYVIPCLNRFDFFSALLDKSFSRTLFSDVLQPRTIVACRNGIFYDASGSIVSREKAASVCMDEQSVIIVKPTVQTACGRGVAVLDKSSVDGVLKVFGEYGKDFICQEKLLQHPILNALNPTSLNTLRVYTYRSLSSEVHFMDDISIVRFGGDGAVFDNALAGGGFCHVEPTGEVDDVVWKDRTNQKRSLKAMKQIENMQIPNFQAVKELALNLHSRLPYFDWLGWDFAIDPEGRPVFIEFNCVAGCEAPQTTRGPIFGKYQDEVMTRIASVEYQISIERFQRFKNGFRRLDGVVTW